jgi:MFS family permease
MYDSGHRRAVAIACAGAFLAFLDATIVNIAFPDISRDFSGSGRDALSWVLDGYFVVIAARISRPSSSAASIASWRFPPGKWW